METPRGEETPCGIRFPKLRRDEIGRFVVRANARSVAARPTGPPTNPVGAFRSGPKINTERFAIALRLFRPRTGPRGVATGEAKRNPWTRFPGRLARAAKGSSAPLGAVFVFSDSTGSVNSVRTTRGYIPRPRSGSMGRTKRALDLARSESIVRTPPRRRAIGGILRRHSIQPRGASRGIVRPSGSRSFSPDATFAFALSRSRVSNFHRTPLDSERSVTLLKACFNGQSSGIVSPRRYRLSNSFDRWANIRRTSRRSPLTLGMTIES